MAAVPIILIPIPPVVITMQPIAPVQIDMLPTYVYGPFTPLINVVNDWPNAPIENEFYIKLNP